MTELREELTLRARDLLLTLNHMHRNTNRARLVCDATLNRLANPPCRIRRKLEPLAPIELLRCTDQTDHAFLDQIAERDALRLIATGDRHDEPQVGVDHALLRGHVATLDALGELDLLRSGQQREAASFVEEHLERVRRQGRVGGEIQVELFIELGVESRLLILIEDNIKADRTERRRLENLCKVVTAIEDAVVVEGVDVGDIGHLLLLRA